MMTFASRILPLLAFALTLSSCGSRELSEKEENEWDAILRQVAILMREQEGPGSMTEPVKRAAEEADTAFPYFEKVMAESDDEGMRSAALHLMTTAYVLVCNDQLQVPHRASAYIYAMEGHSDAAAPLMENPDLVPTYRDYGFTAHSNKKTPPAPGPPNE